ITYHSRSLDCQAADLGHARPARQSKNGESAGHRNFSGVTGHKNSYRLATAGHLTIACNRSVTAQQPGWTAHSYCTCRPRARPTPRIDCCVLRREMRFSGSINRPKNSDRSGKHRSIGLSLTCGRSGCAVQAGQVFQLIIHLLTEHPTNLLLKQPKVFN
ncbi:MAG: hypothetical protein JWR49_3891, partial [Tardiphaga sp.]|nr:hypothetical protein [Tardiphaga sp.]